MAQRLGRIAPALSREDPADVLPSESSRLRMSSVPAPNGHRALAAARGRLRSRALRLLAYLVAAFLVVRLIPSLEEALTSLEHVSWQWVLGAVGLEVLSEMGFVACWRAVVDPDHVLDHEGRGRRLSGRVAWAQLGGGMLVPGGSLSSIGVGAWILHRFGMPAKLIAERQFNLSFLNTAVDAFALIVFGVGLWLGIFPGERRLVLTLLPAAVAALALGATLLLARRASSYAARKPGAHPKLAAALAALAAAVGDTKQLLLHQRGVRSVLGAIAYLVFDMLVLWTAFIAIDAHPLPSLAVVLMAYIIGAVGGSLPLPAGVGSIAGMVGMLILYGVPHSAALAAVILYQAVGQIVPLAGGGIAYLLLRRQLGPIPHAVSESQWALAEAPSQPLDRADNLDAAIQSPPAR